MVTYFDHVPSRITMVIVKPEDLRKHNVLISEYYAAIGQMRCTMSKYFRTARLGLQVMKFIGRR